MRSPEVLLGLFAFLSNNFQRLYPKRQKAVCHVRCVMACNRFSYSQLTIKQPVLIAAAYFRLIHSTVCISQNIVQLLLCGDVHDDTNAGSADNRASMQFVGERQTHLDSLNYRPHLFRG